MRTSSVDVLDHLDEFRDDEEASALELPSLPARRHDHASLHEVNLLVDDERPRRRAVVVERNPTYYNLLGRIEYRAAFGAMVTDFREIKAGRSTGRTAASSSSSCSTCSGTRSPGRR